ncbi:hypothetical protein BH10ACT3_BH10ACT3_11610 [soil metagenome]
MTEPRTTRPRWILAVCSVVMGCALVAGCTSDGSWTQQGTESPDTTIADAPTGDAGGATDAKVVAPDEPGPYQVGRRVIEITDTTRDRTLTADVWYPVDAGVTAEPSIYQFIPGIELPSLTALADAPASADGPFPLVIYSHGSGGLRYVASWFTETLASHGFVVVAVDHTGNTALDSVGGTDTPEDVNAYNRVVDVQFLTTQILEQSADAGGPLGGTIDPERIGVTGHSFGGCTALADASGFSNDQGIIAADDRVTAVAVMAPYSDLVSDDELESIDVPTMLVSGTLDTTTPIEPETTRPWELIPGRPLVRVDVEGAGHQSFTDVCRYQDELPNLGNLPQVFIDAIDVFAEEGCTPEFTPVEQVHDTVNTFTIAFLETYVAGVDGYERYLDPAEAPDGVEVTVKD